MVSLPIVRDELEDPFTPGYGALPRVFAGREPEFRDLEVMARRTRAGIYEQARRVEGIRGIGKTVLLGELAQWLNAEGWWVAALTVAPGGGLIPRLARTLGGVVSTQNPAERAARTMLSVLRVVAAVGLRYGSADWQLEYRGRPVDPDAGRTTGDPVQDVRTLLLETALLARARQSGLVLLLDETQNAEPAELAPLLYALQDVQSHTLTTTDPVSGRTARSNPPLGVVLAGLPSLPDVLARAAATFMTRSKAHRLGPLPAAAIREALPEFSRSTGVVWDADAVDLLLRLVRGYPYFLHVYGSAAWRAGDGAVITADDVRRGARLADVTVAAFHDERLDRLTALQRSLVEALSRLPLEERTGERLAAALGRKGSSAIGSTLARLIQTGILTRTRRGSYDLAVPGMEERLRGGDSAA